MIRKAPRYGYAIIPAARDRAGRTGPGRHAGPHVHPRPPGSGRRLKRQITSAREWLPDGFYVAGYYWDVESGALDIEQRGHGTYEQFTPGPPAGRGPG